MSDATRRHFVKAGLASALMASSPTELLHAEEMTMRQALDYEHTIVPLRFEATSLKGLSAGLIQSHWENNYGGAVKALNAVRSRLRQALNDSGAPPYLYNGLKKEQSMRTGSVVLHELYFESLGGDGKAGANARSTIAASFGSFDVWESEFRRMGQGLGGGSGWVVLGYNRSLDLLENYCMADHTASPPNVDPMLVLDMYEHAYHMDYGAAAAKYIDAFFANVQWDGVGRRLATLRG